MLFGFKMLGKDYVKVKFASWAAYVLTSTQVSRVGSAVRQFSVVA